MANVVPEIATFPSVPMHETKTAPGGTIFACLEPKVVNVASDLSTLFPVSNHGTIWGI